MLIPLKTDAPIYHLPFVTVGLIVINVIVFAAMFMMEEEQLEELAPMVILTYGTFRPWTWVTSNFVHADILHLAGNMVSLWTFGLIVEGKVGWWKFLLIYFGIGFVQCGCEQVMTLPFSEGGSFGASAIVFGLIAIGMIWAPANDMTCALLMGAYVITFDSPVYMVAGVLVILEIGTSILSLGYLHEDGNILMAIGSSTLHLMGAALGFAIGIVMLKKNWVDCENWDLFSVRANKHGRPEPMDTEKELQRLKSMAPVPTISPETALATIREKMAAGSPGEALLTRKEARKGMPQWELPETDLYQLSAVALKQKRWPDVVDLWTSYLQKYATHAVAIRIRLAGVLVEHLNDPRKASKVLNEVPPDRLKPEERKLHDQIRAKIDQRLEDDPYQVAE